MTNTGGTIRQDASADARLAAIVDSSYDAIVGKDLNSIITNWNQAAERMFGYTAEEAVGQSILMLIPEHLQSEETDIIARIRKGERIGSVETIRKRKDGSLIAVSLTISPIRTPEGEIVGASKIARDITAAKESERRIRLLMRRQPTRSGTATIYGPPLCRNTRAMGSPNGAARYPGPICPWIVPGQPCGPSSQGAWSCCWKAISSKSCKSWAQRWKRAIPTCCWPPLRARCTG